MGKGLGRGHRVRAEEWSCPSVRLLPLPVHPPSTLFLTPPWLLSHDSLVGTDLGHGF